MTYYLAAFMIQAYIICDGSNIDNCGYSSWIEYEPSEYQFSEKSECVDTAHAYAKQFRVRHKKTMNIVYTLPACPEYEHKIEPHAFEHDIVG